MFLGLMKINCPQHYIKQKYPIHIYQNFRRITKIHKDSINQGWHNASFRGFADYMQTPEFYAGLKELNQLIMRKGKVAIMCAESCCHGDVIGRSSLMQK